MTRGHLCIQAGCGRTRPMARTSHLESDYYCSRHDGLGDPLICTCGTPAPDAIGQCVRCWRVIPALHPVIAEALA